MSYFSTIHKEANERGLRFVIIGGLAVNYYGFSRETADLDLLISFEDRNNWLNLLSELGYKIYQDGGSFIQFSQPEDTAWPVDLMVVPEKTFVPIFSEKKTANFYDLDCFVPSLEHVLMLKLHALKNTRVNRFLKDYLDVENLIRINHVDIRSQHIRELFLKYGTVDIYEKLSRSLAV